MKGLLPVLLEKTCEDGHRITYAVFASEDKISEKDSTNYNIQNLKTVKEVLRSTSFQLRVGIDNASRKYGEKNPIFSSSKFEFNGATDKDKVALIDEFWKSGVAIKCDATIDSQSVMKTIYIHHSGKFRGSQQL